MCFPRGQHSFRKISWQFPDTLLPQMRQRSGEIKLEPQVANSPMRPCESSRIIEEIRSEREVANAIESVYPMGSLNWVIRRTGSATNHAIPLRVVAMDLPEADVASPHWRPSKISSPLFLCKESPATEPGCPELGRPGSWNRFHDSSHSSAHGLLCPGKRRTVAYRRRWIRTRTTLVAIRVNCHGRRSPSRLSTAAKVSTTGALSVLTQKAEEGSLH